MPIPRLIPQECTLLIIDVQVKLLPDIFHGERMAKRCAFMAQVASELDIPVILTEQVTRVFGPTYPAILDNLPEGTPIFEKSRFSALIGPVEERLREINRPYVIVVGMEAHICILQTVLDLLSRKNRVFVVSDCISSGESDQISPAFRRMEQAGAIVTGSISATYELMADSKHPSFRGLLAGVKRIRNDENRR